MGERDLQALSNRSQHLDGDRERPLLLDTLAWRDVDLVEGHLRLREKGRKVVDVPMPDELVEILRAAVDSGRVPAKPDDYVIPESEAR